MPTTTLIELTYNELPVVFTEQLRPYLEARSAVAVTRVSHGWHALFAHDNHWRYRIMKDFNIPEAPLPKEDIAALATDQPYKHLYANLIKWFSESKNDNTHQMYYQYSQHLINLPTLIACCLNNADYTCAMTPLSETEHWLEICLILDLEQSFSGLARRCTNNERTSMLERAIVVGALKITRHILTHLDDFHLPALDLVYTHMPLANMIVCSPNPKLQQFLMNKQESGLDHESIDRLRNNPATLETLHVAINERNSELADQLLNSEVAPDQITLEYAIGRRNFQLIRRLITHFKIKPTERHLNWAAHVGCLTIFNYLLIENNELIPTEKTLNEAAHSGNIELVNSLLTRFKNLKITSDTAMKAIFSQNVEMVRFIRRNNPELVIPGVFISWHFNKLKTNYILSLLDPELNIDLTINLNFLKLAISHGHFELVRYLITERHIEPNPECMRLAISSARYEILTYLLNRNLNFIPDPQLISLATTRQSHILELLLHPRFRHSIETLKNTLASHHEEVRANKLLKCQIHVKQAYAHLRDNQLIECYQHLGLALSLHLRHGLDLILDTCRTPNAYELTADQALVLMQQVKMLFENETSVESYLLIDRRQALQLLQNATAALLTDALQTIIKDIIKLLKPHCRYQPIIPADATIADTTSPRPRR